MSVSCILEERPYLIERPHFNKNDCGIISRSGRGIPIMLRARANLFYKLLFLVDLLMTCAAFPLAYWSRNNLSRVLPSDWEYLLNPYLHPIEHYFWIIGAAIVWWAVSAFFLGLYRITMKM